MHEKNAIVSLETISVVLLLMKKYYEIILIQLHYSIVYYIVLACLLNIIRNTHVLKASFNGAMLDTTE